jgi:hypothetical protein
MEVGVKIDKSKLLDLFRDKKFCEGLRLLALTLKKLYKLTWTVEEIYYHMMGELLLAKLNPANNITNYLYTTAFQNTLRFIQDERNGKKIPEAYLIMLDNNRLLSETESSYNFENLFQVVSILDTINFQDIRQFALMNLCGITPKELGLNRHQKKNLNKRIRTRLRKANKLELVRKLLQDPQS